MAENFKKRPFGPEKIRTAGSQEWETAPSAYDQSKKYPHGQDPHTKHRPKGHKGFGTEKDPHSPPDTPHRTSTRAGLMSPVPQYGPLRGNPSPNPGHLRTRHMGPEPVLASGSQQWSGGKTGQMGGNPSGRIGGGTKGSQSHTTVQGSRKGAGGGAAMRPYRASGEGGPAAMNAVSAGQKHDRSGAIRPRIMHPALTKHIKGLIGKRTKNRRLY